MILPIKRSWGNYIVIWQQDGVKAKILNFRPGMSTSMQRHEFRSEWWLVLNGELYVDTVTDKRIIGKFENHFVDKGLLHQLSNKSDQPLRILEIQYGEKCDEEDIERL